MEMPDDARAKLERRFERASEIGLRPEWHVGGEGFDYDCPSCAAAGHEHRMQMRWHPRPLIRLTVAVFGDRVIVMPSVHLAHGAAVA